MTILKVLVVILLHARVGQTGGCVLSCEPCFYCLGQVFQDQHMSEPVQIFFLDWNSQELYPLKTIRVGFEVKLVFLLD